MINIKETRLTYNLDFNLDHEKATILLKGGYLSSSLNIEIDEDIIPGDQLIIKYTGDLLIQESYPSKIDIYNGNVVSYKLMKTTVEEVNLEIIDEIVFLHLLLLITNIILFLLKIIKAIFFMEV